MGYGSIQPIIQKQTLEELIAEKSVGMTDDQKAQYWYEICQTAFALLGKVEVYTEAITSTVFQSTMILTYPTLTGVKIADGTFYITTEVDLQNILTKDWTNLVPYVSEKNDCDDFANKLYDHLTQYYGLNSVIPVWGYTDEGYHGFNLAVLKTATGYTAKLIEPQTDLIFDFQGSLGNYAPQEIAQFLGILKI